MPFSFVSIVVLCLLEAGRAVMSGGYSLAGVENAHQARLTLFIRSFIRLTWDELSLTIGCKKSIFG